MSRIDYYDIEAQIAEILTLDETLLGVNVRVEEGPRIDEGLAVTVYLDERLAPDDLQTLAAGQRTTFRLVFTLLCVAPDYESIAAAARARDDLIGKVEVALMKNRTLNGTVRSSWLDGGLLDNARNPDAESFLSVGEVRLIAEVTSTTT